MPLALGSDAGVGACRAIGEDRHPGGLRHPDPGRLGTHGHSHANRLAGLLAGPDPGGVDLRDCLLQQARVVAAVEDHRSEAGPVGHLFGLHQVAAAKLDRVQPEVTGEAVHHALDREIADRPAAAPDESGRWSVGVRLGDLDLERR